MTNKYGPQRPSQRLVGLACALIVAVGELAFLEICEPTLGQILEMNAYLVIGLAAGLLAQRKVAPGIPRSRPELLALCLLLVTTLPGIAWADQAGSQPDPLPSQSSAWDEMGFGDEFPRGSMPSLGGIPCWQLRISDDVEGLIRFFWGAAIGSTASTGVYLLNQAPALGVSGAIARGAAAEAAVVPAAGALVAYISWNALFAEGCGGCGEEFPLNNWEVGECGPLGIDCCIPPDGSRPPAPGGEDEDEDEDQDDAEIADSEHDPDLPLTPALQDTSSGFQGAQDLADYGWLGGGTRPDPDDSDCIDLFGDQCNGMCPPAGNGMCVNSCNTCGGCVYTSC